MRSTFKFDFQLNKVYLPTNSCHMATFSLVWKISTVSREMHYKTAKTLCDACVLFICDQFGLI